jgi:hypothetical protein
VYSPSEAQTAFVPVYGRPPMEQPAPPAPSRGPRTGLWLGLIVVVILILGAGGAAAYIFIHLDQASPTSSRGQPTPPASPSVSHSAPNDGQLSTPDTIGSFRRLASASALGGADQLRTDLGNLLPGAIDSVAAAYQDPSAPASPVVVAAVAGPVPDPAAVVDGIFASAAFSHVHTLAAGPRGGSVKCAQTTDQGATMIECAWADSRSVGFALFLNRSASQSDALFPAFRAAVVPD